MICIIIIKNIKSFLWLKHNNNNNYYSIAILTCNHKIFCQLGQPYNQAQQTWNLKFILKITNHHYIYKKPHTINYFPLKTCRPIIAFRSWLYLSSTTSLCFSKRIKVFTYMQHTRWLLFYHLGYLAIKNASYLQKLIFSISAEVCRSKAF